MVRDRPSSSSPRTGIWRRTRPVRSLARWRTCDATVFSTESPSPVLTNRRRRRSSPLAPASRLPTPRWPSGCATQTGGNPFFIEELMRSLAEAPDAAASVPEGVKDVIGRRLDRLPPPALETLTLAAVLGTDFRLASLRIVASELEPDDLLASLEAAVAAQACRRGSRRGRPLLVRARARARDAVRAADRQPPVPPAPARRGGTRGRAGASAPGRARASLLPGAACRRRGEGRRAQLEGRRGGAGRSCL